MYEAQAKFLVGAAISNPNVTTNDLRASDQIGQIYAALATSRPIVQNMIFMLNLKADPDDIIPNVTAVWTDINQILTIRVRDQDPVMAARLANGVGDALIQRSPTGESTAQTLRRDEVDAEIARLQETIRTTQGSVDQLSALLQQTTDATRQRALIVQLEQQRASLDAAQRSLSEQYAALQGSDVNRLVVAEPAVPKPAPVSPNVLFTVAAAVLAGMVLGLVNMLLLEFLVDVIYTAEDLRQATGLVYLAGITRHRKLWRRGLGQLVMYARPESRAAESYRMLRANLLATHASLRPASESSADAPLVLQGRQAMSRITQVLPTDFINLDAIVYSRSLLLTAPSPRTGTTELAANLAVAVAQAGKTVILVEANLRRPRLAQLFGLDPERGLSQVINSPNQLPEIISIGAVPGLGVLPAGSASAHSADILASSRMQQVLRHLEQRADLVIIDSPSLQYSDALSLAPIAGKVLLVARRGRTDRKTATRAVESLRLVDARIAGAVLNGTRAVAVDLHGPSWLRNWVAQRSATERSHDTSSSVRGTGATTAQAGEVIEPFEGASS
jgi:non-specific protein-tyrosine kinase